MTQKIETYANLMKAYLVMESCNGGIKISRTQEVSLRESDAVIGAEGVYHEDLLAMDEWIGTLDDEEILTLVDGEEGEIAELLGLCPVGEKLDGLLNDLFEA